MKKKKAVESIQPFRALSKFIRLDPVASLEGMSNAEIFKRRSERHVSVMSGLDGDDMHPPSSFSNFISLLF